MQTNDGALLFQVSADISNAQRDIEAIKKQFEQMTNKAVEEGKKQADVWQNLLKGATAYFTLQGAQSFISQMIAVRSQFQQLEISFGTMLKSKEKANALMAQMADLASKTPFGLEEVSEGAKRLLAFQVPAEEVTETLRRMGDVASGLGVPMGQLIHVYGQVKAQGKLMTNDLYQFMNAGIPIIAELSKVVGKSETEIKEMVSAGKIGFPEVQAVIKNMTNEGGLFFNLMAEQSKSLGGQISNLKDNFDQMLNEIGKSSEGIVSEAIKGVSFLVENYQTLGKIIAGLIVTYGTYKTAIIVHNALIALNTQLTNGWTIAQLAQYRGLLLLEKAQKLLNATMLANPYVLVATAVVGLGVALWTLKDNTNLAKKAQEDYNKEKEQIIDNEKAHKQRIDELIESVNNQALADTDRQKALIALQKEYPKIFEKYDIETLKLADILKLKKEIAKIDEEKGKESRKNSQQRYKNNADTLLKIGKGEIKGGFDAIVKNSDLDKDISKAFGKYWRYNPMLDFREIYQYFVEKEKVAKNDVKGDAVASWASNLKNLSEEQVKKELEYRQKLIVDLQKQKKAGNKWASHGVNFGGDWFAFNEEELQAQSKTLQAQLDKLHEQTYSYTDLSKKYADAVKKAEQELADITNNKVGYKTESDYQKAVAEAKEKLKQAKKVYDDFSVGNDKKAKATKTKSEIPTFDQEAHLLQTQRIAIDNELAEQKKGVEALQDGYDKELALIHYFYDEKAEAIRRGGEDARIALEKERANSKGLMSNEAYNARLNAINENEMIANEQNNALKTQQEQKLFDGLLEKYQTYFQKRKSLVEKQERDLIELGKILSNEQLEELKKQQQAELDELDDTYISKNDNYKKLFEDLRELSNKEIEEAIKKAKELLSVSNMSEEMRKSINQRIKDTERMFSQKKLSEINQYSQAVRDLANAFSELGGSTGNSALSSLGSAIGNIAGQFTSLMEAIKRYKSGNISSADKFGAVANFASNLISSIADSSRQRKDAEEQYYTSVISYQNAYNLALIEQKRIQKELDSSFLLKDRTEQLKTEFDSIREVGKQREKQLELIRSKGQVKVGTGSKTDWGGVATMTASGAVTGAMVGNVVGAVVGAVAGFIGGLFSSKKPKDVFGNLLENWPHLLKQSANGVWEIDKGQAEIAKNSGLVNEETKLMLQQYIDLQDKLEKSRATIKEIVTEFAGNLAPNIQNSLVEAFKAGEDAIVKMGETMDKVVENMVSSIIFQSIFKDTFKKLEDEMQKSKDVGGDGNWVDDFGRFYREAGAKTKQYYEALTQARDSAKAEGFNILQDNTQRQAVEKGYMRMSQDTGDELLGQHRLQTQLSAEIKNATLQTANSIKEMHLSMQASFAQQLRHLAGIETNTYKLHKIETDISGMKTILGNIETKGIKMRT